MVNVFTTEFQYNGAFYTAHITQLDDSIHISVPEELHHLLPDGKAVYKLRKGLELSSPELTEYQRLMIAILASIEESGALKDNHTSPNTEKEAE